MKSTYARSIYCARAQPLWLYQLACSGLDLIQFSNRNFFWWCSNICCPSSWGGNRRRAKVLVIRLNNYRRLSGYLGKSCLAVAMDSIAWIAKMICWGDGAMCLLPKHLIEACEKERCVRRGSRWESRIIQEVGIVCIVQDLSLEEDRSTVFQMPLAYRWGKISLFSHWFNNHGCECEVTWQLTVL